MVHALQQIQQSPKCQQASFTIGQYDRLKIGMSREQVELILQPGIEESRSADGEAKFKWENPDGSSIRVVFQKDKLKRKEQVGMSSSPTCHQ
jgi:hypothetical protein